MSTFRNSMMLYRASLSCWTARKKDQAQSAKTNKDAGAVDGAANVYKALLPDSPELLAVQQWVTGFRTWIYNTTLPWDDNGGRVAKVERHMDFMMEAGDRIRAGYALVEDFLAKYQSAIEEAKFKLNGMFNPLDYPTPEQVRHKFLFTIECEAVPEAADFRIVDGLPPEEVERLVASANERMDQRITAAIDEAYDRLREVVVKFATTLDDYGNKRIKKFNDTLSTNIGEIAGLIPALNLTSDPQLTALALEAKALTAYDLKDLRKDEAVRNAAIAEARLVAAKFPGATSDQFAQALAAVTDPIPALPAVAAAESVTVVNDVPALLVDPFELGQGW